jgi:hypothetical protein
LSGCQRGATGRLNQAADCRQLLKPAAQRGELYARERAGFASVTKDDYAFSGWILASHVCS